LPNRRKPSRSRSLRDDTQFWQQRTNVWPRITNPARRAKRLRNATFNDRVSAGLRLAGRLHENLYIATTAKRDAVLQKAVREISKKRPQPGLFKVDVLFWDDVCQDLAKDDDIFFRHYPQFRQGTDPVTEHDKTLFDELIALLSSEGVIGFINRHNMGFSFELDELNPLSEFHARWNAPERTFIIPELDAARQALWLKAKEYLIAIATETFPTDTLGWQSVPEEWEEEQPERFRRAIEKLHALAGELVGLHADLVRVGRNHLIGVRD
jgi:hypothetical protein